jgi:FMN phosphatase YigB (HAD superfamily)
MIILPSSNKITHITSDFDGVVYNHTTLADAKIYEQLFHDSYRQSVKIEMKCDDVAEIDRFCDIEYEEYLDILLKRTLAPDADEETILKAKQFSQSLFHKNMFTMFTPHQECLFGPSRAYAQDLQKIKALNVTFGILSLADKEQWIEPILKYTELLPYVDYIIDYQGMKFIDKGKSAYPVKMALDTGASHPRNTVFIEDNEDNLFIAKENFSDLKTIWVAPTAKASEKPLYVDYHAKDFKEALSYVHRLAS